MVTITRDMHRKVSAAQAGGLVLAVAGGALFLTAPANAQQPAQPPAAPASAEKKPAGKKEEGSSWVKLCDEPKGDKKVKVCLTHHERFHPTTGQPLISAAIRKVDGQDQEMIFVMVPLGRLIAPGLILKVDEEKPVQLKYSYCTALGCVAEAPASPEIIGKLKKGGQLSIGTIDIARKRIGFRIPLTGFTRAYDGPPVDRKIYVKARKELFNQIRARQAELMKRAKAAAAKKKVESQGQGAAPKKTP